MTLSAEHSAQESKPHTTPPQKFPVLTPIAVGLVGAIIYAIGMGTPALWGDEAASIMSAQRSWDSLWAMAGNVDAVHTAYYAFLHLWIDVFGASAVSVRVPSAIAIGVTLSGIYVLTRIFAGHRLALVASLFSLVIPRMDFMAAEARSTAFSAALATWLTILVVHLVRSKDLRLRWWILYGVGLAISIHVFLYTALIAVVHGIALLVLRAPRGVWWRWLIASAAAAVVCLPFIKLANGQHGQIAFLANRDVTSPTAILVQQWFGKQPLAIAAWAAVIFAAAWAVWSWRRKQQVPAEAGRRQLVWISLAWLIVPMVLLLLANTVVGPLYTGRYLSFSAPAAGILIALALAALKPRLLAIVAGVVILVLAVPIMVTQRGVTAKGSDWSQVSEYIGAHSEAGDGVIFDESIRPSRKPRLALRLYPEGFQNTTDLGLVRPYDDTAWLWDIVEPLQVIPNVLDGVDRVWVVARSPQGMSEQENFLIQNGYTLVDTHKLKLDRIMLYSKKP